MGFETLEKKIIEELKKIYDPEIPINIYDLGLIYSIEFEKNGEMTFCLITMTLTSAGCPVSENLVEQIGNIVYSIQGEGLLEIYPELVFDPPWSKEMMSDETKLALGML